MSQMGSDMGRSTGKGPVVRRSVTGGPRLDRPRRGGAPSYPPELTGVSRDKLDGRTRPVSSVRTATPSRAGAVRACDWDDVYSATFVDVARAAGLAGAAEVQPEPVVLTPRGRLVVGVVVLLLALAGFAMLGGGADAVASAGADRAVTQPGTQPGTQPETQSGTQPAVGSSVEAGSGLDSVLVRPGDTAWTIAEQVAPDADPRATIDRIKELNGLDDLGSLRVGDRLVVPTASSGH